MADGAQLDKAPKPTNPDIDAGMTNICRCGPYQLILVAIKRAAGVLPKKAQCEALVFAIERHGVGG